MPRFLPPASTEDTTDDMPTFSRQENAGSQQTGDSRLDRILNSGRFRELVVTRNMLVKSRVDPAVGDTNRLLDRVEDLTRQVAEEFDMDPRDVGHLVQQHGENLNLGQIDERAKEVGTNVVGAAAGVMEPIMAPGDTTRTFIASLAEVQAQRDARIAGEEYEPDVQGGTASGSPASNPLQAAVELGRAGARTVDEMGYNEWPFRQNAEGEGILGWEGNPESAWFVYAPDLRWNRFQTGISPYEADLAPTGRDLVDRFNVAERFGVESEEGKEWLGLGMEVLMDPLIAGDWFSMGARVSGGIARATGSTAARATANSLDNAATQVWKAFTPAGAVGLARKNAPLLTDPIGKAVSKGFNTFLDAELPGAKWLFEGTQRRAAEAMGFQEGIPSARIRDLFWQNGRIEGLGGQPFEFLTGSERFGQSIGELAMGQERRVRDIGIRGAHAIGEALTQGLTQRRRLRLPGARISIPSAKVVTPEMEGYVRGLGAIVNDFVDIQGPGRTGIPSSIKQRLEDVASTYGMDYSDALQRFEGAAAATRGVTLRTGYLVSGYEDYVTAMQRASADLGIEYTDVRRAYEQQLGGLDLQQMELDEFFRGVDPKRTGAAPGDEAARARARALQEEGFTPGSEAWDMFEETVAGHLDEMGRTDLRGVDPRTYLQGMREGYLRRNFLAVDNPKQTMRALENRQIITLRQAGQDEVVTGITDAFGDDAAEATRRFLRSRTPEAPRGMTPEDAGPAATVFRTDDLAQVISRRAGRNVTPNEVADIIYGDDANYAYLKQTMETVSHYLEGGRPYSGGSGGVPWGMTPSAFASREEFNLEKIVEMVVAQDPVQAVAQVARRGGRQVRAQSFLGESYDNLKDLGMLMDSKAAGRKPLPNRIVPFTTEDGLSYVMLPDNRGVWGPLAGQAVPKEAARLMVYSIQSGGGARGTAGRLFSMMRRGLISPLPTALRNVVGNFILINQAGGNLPDMLQTLPEAHALRRAFLETGELPGDLRGYEHMFNWMDGSTMTGTVERGLDDLLREAARGDLPAETRISQLFNAAETAVEFQSTQPLVGGFLNFFKYGEEVSRLTAFMTKHRELLGAGVDMETAVRRASHFAANSAYNYGATPLIPSLLKRTGLAAFPQFTWFTMGRTPRVLAERPQVLARVEHARQAANQALMPSTAELPEDVTAEDEEVALTELMATWLQSTQPLAFPIPGEDGNYRVADFSYVMPQGANVADLVQELFSGGLMSPLVDAWWATAEGTGRGPFSARFGTQFFDPSAGPLTQATQVGISLASQAVFPGLWRVGGQLAEAVDYGMNRDAMDLLTIMQSRYHNADLAQFLGRQVGINTREVSTRASGQSIHQRVNDLERKYEARLASIGNKKEEVIARIAKPRSPEAREAAREEFARLNEMETRLRIEKARELARLWGRTR